MEVILIKDLKRKGTFGDVIEVADGYARNYLIPNGFALAANKANKKRFEEIKDKVLVDVSKLRDSLHSTANEIKGKTFSMKALSRDGKLYGSITPTIIASQIKKDLPDVSVNASDIIVEEGNIKFVGTYACKAQFTKDISASFSLVIESDETHEQPELLEAILEDKTPNKKIIDELETDEDAETEVISDDTTETIQDEPPVSGLLSDEEVEALEEAI